MCEVRPVPGRGLGLVATRNIGPGEVVLSELPLIVYPQYSSRHLVCRHCLRLLNGNGGTAKPINFCSEACALAAVADAGSQTAAVTAAEVAIDFTGLSDEASSTLLLLLRIASLKTAAAQGVDDAAAKLVALAALTPGSSPGHDVATLVARLPPGHGLSLEDADQLLRRDAANAYGIALHAGSAALRGSALGAVASRLNHECLPNVARIDDFDAPVAGQPQGDARANTAIAFKALHAIPAGEELTQSYFPLDWEYEERQARCHEVYGFRCTCPCCRVDEALAKGLPVDPAACGGADEGYVHMFLLKFKCPVEDCSGSLVPVSAQQPDHAQCNVCGWRRTDEEFEASLAMA